MAGLQDEIEALKAQIAALTARVFQLEQRSAAAPGPGPPEITRAASQTIAPPPQGTMVSPTGEWTRPALPQPGQMPPAARQAGPLAARPSEDTNLEKKIGQHWLNRVGIIAILFGISYFLKYAFENNWIGPAGRLAIGLVAGIALLGWSERFMRRGYKTFSYSLKALGIGILYLSLWAAFQLYHLIPAVAAFAAMVILTGGTIVLALAQDAELLAGFALVGGFVTPVLLSTGHNHEAVLFTYLGLLDLAVLALAVFKPWRRLLWGSFAGTVILYLGWFIQFYSISQRPLTVFFAAIFAAIFAGIPLAAWSDRSPRSAGPSMTLALLPLLNAAVLFLALSEMYEQETITLAWYALGLAAVYLGISSLFKPRFPHRDTTFGALLHVTMAITFITIAIPLGLSSPWITIGWLVEAGALLWLGGRKRVRFLGRLAILALGLGIVRLLFFDRFHTETLVFNARFATYMVAIGVLAGIVRFGKRHGSAIESPLLGVALVTMNLLALIALTWEVSDYFDRQLSAAGQTSVGSASSVQLRLARDFSYSAIWLVYGVILMVVGFRKRSAFIRWQSLVLIAVTVGKVFLYDVSALDKGYRILSFVALGAVLLAISFVYQRDWLRLSPRSSEKAAGETSR
jgi:uncharacterized membrane protein